MDGNSILNRAKEVFQGISISEEQAKLIESATRAQRACSEWMKQRVGRLTASSFHDVFVRRDTTDPEPLIKHIMGYDQSDLSSIPAIKWGIENETTAREEYIVTMSSSHASFKCDLAGLVINPLYPFLGASPDGFTECDCCGKGLLEIKCPFSGKDLHPSALKGRPGSFLTDGGLNRSHKYYTQVQGQLAITNRQFCDFVVWTPIGLITQRIYHDSFFGEKVVKKLTSCFVENILPEILTHKLKRSLESDDECVYSVCQGRVQGGRMIGCDNPSCIYHYQCIGIKRAPKGSWYCPSCK